MPPSSTVQTVPCHLNPRVVGYRKPADPGSPGNGSSGLANEPVQVASARGRQSDLLKNEPQKGLNGNPRSRNLEDPSKSLLRIRSRNPRWQPSCPNLRGLTADDAAEGEFLARKERIRERLEERSRVVLLGFCWDP